MSTGKAIDIRNRTFDFAVRIVKLCRHLDEKPGTSRTLPPVVKVSDFCWGTSTCCFGLVPEQRLSELLTEADEIMRVIGAIIVSAKKSD